MNPIIILTGVLVVMCSLKVYSQNLIQNWTFEDTTLAGWMNEYCGMSSFQNAPSGGDVFCVQIPFGNLQGCFPNYVFQVVPNVQSGEIYELSAFVRNTGFQAFGSIKLGKKTSNGTIVANQLKDTTSASTWTQLVIRDSFSLDINDSAVVILESGLLTGAGSGYTYVDMVYLEKVDTVLNLIDDKKKDEIVTVHQELHQITIASKKTLNGIQLINMSGSVILFKRVPGNNRILINTELLLKGIYLLQVETENNYSYVQKISIL